MALIEITDNIKRFLDERNYVIGIFNEFKKVFDTVDHEIMLKNWNVMVSESMQICCFFFRSYINHLPPACWSTFRKSNSKQQLGCRFDIMDYESYSFVFWHMQLYMSWYIISFFGFTFLNIPYSFMYSCTNIFL